MSKKLLIFGLIAALFYACLPADFEKPVFTPAHYRYLLHGDSAKFWMLTERYIDDSEVPLSMCDTAIYFQFKYLDGTANVNRDSLFFHNYVFDCNDAASDTLASLLKGRFSVGAVNPDIGFTDSLFFFINNDTMLTIVKEITPTYLDIVYEYQFQYWIRDRFIWIPDPTPIVEEEEEEEED